MTLTFDAPFIPEPSIKSLIEKIIELAIEDIDKNKYNLTTLYSIFGENSIGGYKYFEQIVKIFKNIGDINGLSIIVGFDNNRNKFPVIHIMQQRLNEITFGVGQNGSQRFAREFDGTLVRGKPVNYTKMSSTVLVYFTSKNQAEAYMLSYFFTQVISAYKNTLLSGNANVTSLSISTSMITELYDSTNATGTGSVYTVPMEIEMEYESPIINFGATNINLPTLSSQKPV